MKKTLSAIIATSQNHVIGRANQLPWHLPADLKHFKSITWGKPVIMGRKTFESIGRPLPGRQNIILTRDPSFHLAGCDIVHSFEELFEILPSTEEAFIIGGAELYTQALPFITRFYLTLIDAVVEGDTFFPPLNETEWREVSREDHEADEHNPYCYHFSVLEKR